MHSKKELNSLNESIQKWLDYKNPEKSKNALFELFKDEKARIFDHYQGKLGPHAMNATFPMTRPFLKSDVVNILVTFERIKRDLKDLPAMKDASEEQKKIIIQEYIFTTFKRFYTNKGIKIDQSNLQLQKDLSIIMRGFIKRPHGQLPDVTQIMQILELEEKRKPLLSAEKNRDISEKPKQNRRRL